MANWVCSSMGFKDSLKIRVHVICSEESGTLTSGSLHGLSLARCKFHGQSGKTNVNGTDHSPVLQLDAILNRGTSTVYSVLTLLAYLLLHAMQGERVPSVECLGYPLIFPHAKCWLRYANIMRVYKSATLRHDGCVRRVYESCLYDIYSMV